MLPFMRSQVKPCVYKNGLYETAIYIPDMIFGTHLKPVKDFTISLLSRSFAEATHRLCSTSCNVRKV